MKFRRLEIGMRIEQDANSCFFSDFRSSYVVDPKFKYLDSEKRWEWRTFCACHRGMYLSWYLLKCTRRNDSHEYPGIVVLQR